MAVVAMCCVFIAVADVSSAMAKGFHIHVHFKRVEHTVSHAVHHATRSVQRGVKHATRKVTRTAKKVERGTKKAASAVRRTTDRVAHTAEKGVVHVANKVGTPVVRSAERTARTVIHAAEHPKETVEALEKTAVNLARYATMDVSDIMHGNIKKLMSDTARQQSAINRGIARDTGVSVGVLNVIDDMMGAALTKAAGRVAENPRAALEELKKDARAAAAAARTDAADIASGNGAKLLRDMTNQQASVMGVVLKTQVQLTGLPVPKSMMSAALTYQSTMLKMMSGQGAAEIIEAIAHGKANTALIIATRDANTLQGTGLTNAANSEIHKATGISTAVLNTAEQIGSLFVGGGQEALVSDTARVVAQDSVKAASEDAVKAGVKAASDDAARQATQTGTRQATRTAEREATQTGTRQATRDAGREATQESSQQATREAAETGARRGTREITSPGAREATEVIPQGIVRDRVRYFEGLSRRGVTTAVEDGTRTGARTAVEDATRTGTETAVQETGRTAERTATGDAGKVAGKGSYDEMVKSRLNAVAEDAAREATRNGLSPAQVEVFTRGAVRKAGDEIANDTANYARYAMLAAKGKGTAQVWEAAAADAATEALLKASPSAAKEYMARWAAAEGAHIEEVAARVSGSKLMRDPRWIASSLTYYAATSPTVLKGAARLGEIAIDKNEN